MFFKNVKTRLGFLFLEVTLSMPIKRSTEDILMNEIVNGKSISLCFPEYKIYSSAIVGGSIPIALGAARQLNLKIKRKSFWAMGE